jgi:hypothetical protein
MDMVRNGATTSAGDREARGERLGEAGPRSALPYDIGYSRARWHAILRAALVALPFVLGVLVPVLLLALLHWLS